MPIVGVLRLLVGHVRRRPAGVGVIPDTPSPPTLKALPAGRDTAQCSSTENGLLLSTESTEIDQV